MRPSGDKPVLWAWHTLAGGRQGWAAAEGHGGAGEARVGCEGGWVGDQCARPPPGPQPAARLTCRPYCTRR